LGARRMADALLAHSCKMDLLGFEPRLAVPIWVESMWVA
jgi:hypothetical protein